MATMLMVSCRRNFWSPTDFSPADEIRRVDLDSGLGTVVPPAEYLAAMQNKRVTVLVHGYNNEERDVIVSYRSIDARMRLLGFLDGVAAQYDALVGFVWPGGAVGVSFPFARMRASGSAPRFATVMSGLKGAGAVIDLNTHSLGSHVAFEALRNASATVVRYAWNFASAVDNESVEEGERYFGSTQRCTRFYVFHSKRDPVLRLWYRVGDLFEFDTALGYSGPEDPGQIIRHSPNVRVVNCKDVVQSHGGYRSSGEVWSYMADELTAPAPDQFVTLSRTPEALDAVFHATAHTTLSGTATVRRRRAAASGGAKTTRRGGR